MAFKNLVCAILAAVLLFICSGAFFFGSVASQDAEFLSGEQQASSQYYRPYYNYNRRPVYPVRRPAYNYYYNQRPQRPAAAPSNTNYRPAPAPTTAARPSSAAVTGTSCRSSNSYQQYGICWAADSQRLQISPSLTIENFVRFHKMNMYVDVFDSSSYRRQLCEQSRRFNSVGVLCVTGPDINSEDDDDCVYRRAGGERTFAAKMCITGEVCICVVGDPYESIADNTKAPNDNFDALLSGTGYRPAWTVALNQDIQNTLAASGIYWRP